MTEHAVDEIDVKVLLKQRVTDFGRAVDDLVEKQPEWCDGVGRWRDSVYTRVRGAVLGRSAPMGKLVPGSRAPGRLGPIDWCATVDKTVARWSRVPGTTAARLIELREQRWRVEDCDLLADRHSVITGWLRDAALFLGEAPLHVYLRGHRCPQCSASHVFIGAEKRRVPSLLATELGVSCQQCGLTYEPERWGLLAGILNG